MKKIRLTVFLFAAVLFLMQGEVFAQGRFGKDSADCVNYLNFYRDFYSQNNMADATVNWVKAMQYCPPTASENLFVHGKKIMRYRINNAASEAEKQTLIDSLFWLNETRAQYYPKRAKTVKEDIIRDLMFFYGADESKSKQIYDYIDNYVDMFGASADPQLVVNGMIKAGDAFKKGEISELQVMSAYQKYNSVLEARKLSAAADPAIEEEEARLQAAFAASGAASCENFVSVLTPRFENNMNNYAEVENIASILKSNECMKTDLFSKVVAQMYKLNPSAEAAMYLYNLYAEQGDDAKALEYLKEAANISEGLEKGVYMYMLATVYYKDHSYGTAASYARQAGELNPNYAGKADLMIGNIWAASNCSGNEIDKRAKFWVATDYMQKAKAKDPSLEAEANKNIARYRAYFPQAADAFMFDLTDGKSYTVSCGGMTATTIVRTNK